MAMAAAGSRVAASLKRVYDELEIPQKDIDCLSDHHRIWNSQDLVMKRPRLKLRELVGVSESAQQLLEVVADFVESKGVDAPSDLLANFTRSEYIEYIECDDIGFSAASEHGVNAISGTKDDPVCCDSTMDEEEGGAVTFLASSIPNASFLYRRLPITVTIQGDLANTGLGAATSSSNMSPSLDGKPKAKSFPDKLVEPEGVLLAKPETVEEIDDSDTCNLDEEARQAEMARIQDIKLVMMNQGLMQGPVDSPTDVNESVPDSILETEEFYGVDGLKLRKGNCYHYQRQQVGSQVILGIISFQASDEKKVMAKCVLVVPYSVTALGEMGVEKNPFPGGVNFFQVRQDLDLFPLSSFTRECFEPTTIPDWIYEPKTSAAPQAFAYVCDNKGRNRVGRRTEMRFVDLFCGAGGMHQGYKDAGFKPAMAVDIDPMAMDTFEANNPDAPVFRGHIKLFLEHFKTQEDFRQKVGRYEVVHASPPCSPYSALNRPKSGEEYLANRELSKTTFIECIRYLGPNIVIYENVEGILHGKSIDDFRDIVTELIRMGYQVRSTVLKACDFGDPQQRRRLIIFAAKRFVLMPSIPQPTHGDGTNLLPFVTAKNVLEKLRSADPSTIPNIVDCKTTTIPEGVHGVKKLDADKLAPAVRAGGPAVLHYAEDRCVNVRESAALQGFPNDYEFFGSRTGMSRQVGNAVPIKLATAIARSVKDSLEYEYEEESGQVEQHQKYRNDACVADSKSQQNIASSL